MKSHLCVRISEGKMQKNNERLKGVHIVCKATNVVHKQIISI